MRIAVNARFLLPNRLEGIGRFTYEVLQRLALRRPDDEFILFFDRPFDPDFVNLPNMQGVVLPPPTRHPLLWYLWFHWVVPRALRRHRADLFLSMDGYCAMRTDVPTVMVTHDIAHCHYPHQIPFAARWYYAYFVPRYLRQAAAVVTVSHFCKVDIHRQYGTPLDKLHVACNAAAPAFRPLTAAAQAQVRAQYTQGRPYFFYLGAVHPRKNLPRLIEAFDVFKTLTSADTQLLIGGRLAWQTGPVNAAWAAATHRDAIQFLGYVPDDQLPGLVGAADALTYVSLFEGFGVPLIEAMQAGVPVITSNVTSMPEVAGGAALVVNPLDTAAIAAAMQQLYTDPHLRQQLVTVGLQRSTTYTWDAAVDAVERAIGAGVG